MVFSFIGCDYHSRPDLINWPSNWIGEYKHSDSDRKISIDRSTIGIIETYEYIHRAPAAPGWCYLNSINETSFTLVRRIDEDGFDPIIGPVMYIINKTDEAGKVQNFTTDRDIFMGYAYDKGNTSYIVPLGTYVRID